MSAKPGRPSRSLMDSPERNRIMKLSPSYEKIFSEYTKTSVGLTEILLGSDLYDRKVRMSKHDAPELMLENHEVALKNLHSWGISTSRAFHMSESEKFEQLRQGFMKQKALYERRRMKKYPPENPHVFISGSFYESDPPEVKERMLFLSYAINILHGARILHHKLATSCSKQMTP
jgi:hypothetical protein